MFPDFVEIYMCHYVLGYGHGVVKVKNCMPPAPWNEYSLSWVLNELYKLYLLVILRLANAREYLGEVVDGLVFIVLAAILLAFDNWLGQILFEEHPPLMPNKGRVPRRRAKRVNMNSRPRPLRPHQ